MRGTVPQILNLDTRSRWVVSFTSRQLYPQNKRPRYPLYKGLRRPQNRSGQGGEEKEVYQCPYPESNAGRPASNPVSIERPGSSKQLLQI